MDTAAAPALGIIMGTRKGETRLAPLSRHSSTCSSSVSSPPTPVPRITPARWGSASSESRPPACSMAMAAAATANWAKRSTRLASLGPNQAVGSKPGTRRSPSGGDPHRPSQKASRPMPQHASTPIPVTATLRPPASWPVGPLTVRIRPWSSRA